MGDRLDRIKYSSIKRPYLFSFIGIALVYFFLDIYLNKTYITYKTIFTHGAYYFIPFILLITLIPILVSLNINLIFIKFKDLNKISKASGFAALGAFWGIFGGACPSCFIGLLPAMLGLFGIVLNLGNLPLMGLEIQLFSIIFLILGTFYLTRDNKCNNKIKLN